MMLREDWLERASVIANDAADIAERKLRAAKLRVRMKRERARTDAELLRLGEMVYRRIQQGEIFDAEIGAVADSVERHEAMMWELQSRIDNLE